MTQLVCFSHHKGASRLFRFQIFQPLAESLGREVIRYQALNRLLVFGQTELLELHSMPYDQISTSPNAVIIFGNAGPRVVRAMKTASSDFKGVHVVRDPRQMLISAYFHHRAGHDIIWPGFYWEKLAEDRPVLERLNQEDGILYELDNISADVLGQMAAWEADERILEMRLEDVERDAASSVRSLLKFLGIEGDHGIDVTNATANPDSKKWSDAFTPRIKSAFKNRFGDLLLRYGYEKDNDW